jgi:hypothetical protein
MKIIVHGPAAGPGPSGLVESWAPDQPVEVDDGDKQAVAWARSVVASGLATLGEDAAAKETKAPAPPPAPARQEKPAAPQSRR